jgi:hypothetical protein
LTKIDPVEIARMPMGRRRKKRAMDAVTVSVIRVREKTTSPSGRRVLQV